MKTTTKWLLMATTAVVLSAGILVAIPMYANRNQPTTRWAPDCPPPKLDGTVILFPNPDNCSEFYECDFGIPVVMECPEDLFFCPEMDSCSWIWDPQCTFDCVVPE